jgi:predicted DNA-binding transcriptional regulator YafY
MDSPLLLNALGSVRQKLAAAFSDRQQARIRELRGRVFVGAPASPQVVATYRPPSREALAAVKSAFLERRRLKVAYTDEAGRVTSREVEPQFLYLNVPVWYLLAWDYLRDGVRFFRVDRLRQVEKLAASFRMRDPRPFLLDAEQTVKTL